MADRQGRRLFTSEQDQQIRLEYEAGAFLAALVRKWGGTKATLSSAIRRAGGVLLNRYVASVLHRRKFTDEQEVDICGRYQSGSTTAALGQLFGCSPPAITAIVRKHGCPYRGRRQRSVKENVFANAESDPIASYFVGFILADGCVTDPHQGRNGQAKFAIAVHHEDGCILESLRDFLGSTHTLNRNKDMLQLSINSNRLVNDLARYGIVPRKSLTAKVADVMAFNRDFWRGVVDGDGCIAFHTYSNHPLVRVCGSLHTCESFLAFSRTICTTTAKPLPNQTIWSATVASRKAIAVAKALYQECVISLPRKKVLAERCIAMEGRDTLSGPPHPNYRRKKQFTY